jgi:ribosome-associated protein
MLTISRNVSIPERDIDMQGVRAQGAGGQNVNKVSSAIHLRFDIVQSSLPDFYKQRLLLLRDKRITRDGVVVIKAQRYRTQEKNREDALQRLQELVRSVSHVPRARVATKPTRSSQRKRLDEKTRHSRTKQLRGRVKDD